MFNSNLCVRLTKVVRRDMVQRVMVLRGGRGLESLSSERCGLKRYDLRHMVLRGLVLRGGCSEAWSLQHGSQVHGLKIVVLGLKVLRAGAPEA